MSLKITNASGFKIDGVLNPQVTTIYARCLVNMMQERLIPGKPVEEGQEPTEENEDKVEIQTGVKVTLDGARFGSNGIGVTGVSPIYQLLYSTDISDMNVLYGEVEADLKRILEERHPDWTIEIITVGLGPVVEP